VLKVISSSPGDLQPVFDAILENATRICEAKFGNLFLWEGDALRNVGLYGVPQQLLQARTRDPMLRPGPNVPLARAVVTKKVQHVIDIAAEQAYLERDPAIVSIVELGGARTLVAVPMLKDDELIGVITIYRQEVKPFTEKQIELVQSFAAQAVIAIENTRLLSELRQRTDDLTESLEQQTATSAVLNVISRSPTNAQPVFDVIVESATRLCEGVFGVVWRYDDNLLHFVASYNFTPEVIDRIGKSYPKPPDRSLAAGRAILEGRIAHIPDMLADNSYAHELALAGNWRASIAVPILRDGKSIGAISVGKADIGPFSDRQIQLLTTFADQAVIAIENVRLFDEVQKRTEDLTESLQQQTATADVLKVISRSAFDLQTVLDTLTESAARLSGADMGSIARPSETGNFYHVTNFNFSRDWVAFTSAIPLRPGRGSVVGRALMEGRTVQVPDVLADADYSYIEPAKEAGYRTFLAAPMMREGQPTGVLVLARRRVEPFSERQVELISTFADQAAIAIENVRLFDEVQKRTEDLSESLEQQTATADVLKVISRSTFDLHTVLDTLLKSAARLCDADQGTITQRKGDIFYRSVAYGFSNDFLQYVKDQPVEATRNTGTGRALLEGKVVHIPDVNTDREFDWPEAQRLGGFRTMLGVPMLREGEAVGVLALTRAEVRPFTDKQIALVSTFADQAAIAIENVRLFDEIQEKSRQLEEASQHKSRFLANMSHELRTPLNAILGYTELIQDAVYGEPPEKMVAVLERISRNGKHLLGLINDVLDLSKIEAGQLVLSLDAYSLRDVVHGVYSAIEPLAVNKSLTFKVEMAPDLPPGRGDERRLTQVLLNLVGNAIKFTDQGAVTIKASAENGDYTLAVRDTGPGISEADQAKLFQEFQQADNSITKAKGGTGLGLAISKRIIEMHGGKIWVESRPGQGSTFSLKLPIQVEQARQP
jgi:signal transduction histidine kinase